MRPRIQLLSPDLIARILREDAAAIRRAIHGRGV